MEELVGIASLRDAGITAGIATDKLLALSTDSLPQVNPHVHVHVQTNDLIREFNDLSVAWERVKPRKRKQIQIQMRWLLDRIRRWHNPTGPTEGCAGEKKPG
jgi:hypothetical protein